MRVPFVVAASAPSPLVPLVAIVAAHGATDLDSPFTALPKYAACCLAPVPAPLVAVAFCVASVAHFARDVGIDNSIALHALLGFCTLAFGVARGLSIMLIYMSVVHVPLHYMRVCRDGRYLALLLACVVTGVAYVHVVAAACASGVVWLGPREQRIVVAHVWQESESQVVQIHPIRARLPHDVGPRNSQSLQFGRAQAGQH